MITWWKIIVRTNLLGVELQSGFTHSDVEHTDKLADLRIALCYHPDCSRDSSSRIPKLQKAFIKLENLKSLYAKQSLVPALDNSTYAGIIFATQCQFSC